MDTTMGEVSSTSDIQEKPDSTTDVDMENQSNDTSAEKLQVRSTTEDSCPICDEPYDNPDQIVKLPCTPIQHSFHEECVGRWLPRSRTCPYCRSIPAYIINSKGEHLPAPDSEDSDDDLSDSEIGEEVDNEIETDETQEESEYDDTDLEDCDEEEEGEVPVGRERIRRAPTPILQEVMGIRGEHRVRRLFPPRTPTPEPLHDARIDIRDYFQAVSNIDALQHLANVRAEHVQRADLTEEERNAFERFRDEMNMPIEIGQDVAQMFQRPQ